MLLKADWMTLYVGHYDLPVRLTFAEEFANLRLRCPDPEIPTILREIKPCKAASHVGFKTCVEI
jgi:hypothetical protein